MLCCFYLLEYKVIFIIYCVVIKGVYHLTIQDPRPAARCARSGWLQASLRLAKGWITFTNGVFDSREPPIWVPLTARPQVCVLVVPPPAAVVRYGMVK